MSLARAAAQLLQEAGVQPSDILEAAGVNREQAIRQLAEGLGVDLGSLAAEGRGEVREVNDSDVAKVREGLAILNRAFG